MSGPLGSQQWMYASGAEEGQSLRFNDNDSAYLSWTPAAAGNRKTWTWSGWLKRGNLTGSQMQIFSAGGTNGDNAFIVFEADNTLLINQWTGFSSNIYLKTNQVFRDVSNFYNIVLSCDTTQAAASDRIKVWVNGEQVTSFSTATYPPQNFDTRYNSSEVHALGCRSFDNVVFFDGYLSDIHFIDGQALDASSFGQFTDGYWEAIDYAGTYGTNGFHLTFQDDVVSEGFNAVTYRGNGGTQSISGLGFEPDLVWGKSRSGTTSHFLFDSVRGATKDLRSDLTQSEQTNLGLTSFDADGFSISSSTSLNGSGGSYVAWAWDAGSGSPVSNTDGSITSSVKSNPSYGFSIVGWAGTDGSLQTVGHGLNATPELFIIKNRTTTGQSWVVYTTAVDGSFDFLILEDANAKTDSGLTAPTSSVFSVVGNTSNKSGSDHIAYCFHSVAGYSSIGSYTGTGAAGNAVTGLGFKPAFVLLKGVDSSSQWEIIDNTRDPDEANVDKRLYPNLSNAESSGTDYYSFDSDGFTVDTTDPTVNQLGDTYIYMAFADTRQAAFWKDVSGQGNHWTPNNLDYRDSLIDSPANNFATLNSIASGDYFSSGQTSFTLSEGNLKYGSTGRNAFGTMAVSSGKWYFEWVNTNNTVAAVALGGLLTVDERGSVYGAYYNRNGNKGLGLMNTGATETAYGATWTDNDVIGVAVDMDAATPTVTFYKNGSSQGAISVSSFANKTVMPWIQNGANTNNMTGIFNFGQDSTFAGARPAGGNQDDNGTGDFAYAPPAGYLALCTANLPTPTIIDGSEHFNTVLYNGNNNTGSQSVTGVGFQPDFLWLKERTSTNQLYLVDSVRGDNSGVMRTLYSSLTIAEEDTNNQYVTEYGIISSLDSDGFTVDSGSANSGATNLVGRTYAAWNWKAGGTAVSNTDGSITSSVSANPDAGFAVGTYTGNATAGATIGHSLGATPEMVIVKRRTNARDWAVYHKDQSATPTNAYLLLNSTAAVGVGSTAWNNGTFTSSVFTIGSHELVNFSGDSYVFYAFRGIEGYSKVGSYVGNGSADGTFVYTGFRPAWVMVKRTDAADDWHIYDDTRDSYNPEVRMLAANLSDAENVYGTARMDFLCNGVKMRANASTFNASGGSYIYLAFAERPFKYANAR